MTRKLGVSVISLLPYSLGPDGLGRSVELAKKAGLSGVKALPLHGWDPKKFPLKGVMSIQEAWRSSTNHYSANVKNYLLFDREHRSFYIYNKLLVKYPYALRSMRGVYVDAVEIRPELNITEDEYLKAEYPVVLDTQHIRRMGDSGQTQITKDPEGFITDLGKRIQLIQLQLSEEEEDDLFHHNEKSDIVKIVRTLNLNTKCNVILETIPKFQSKDQLIKRLRGLFLATTRYLH